MKNRFHLIMTLVFSLVLSGLLSACGYGESDAKEYTQMALDIISAGKSDIAIESAQASEEDFEAVRDEMVKNSGLLNLTADEQITSGFKTVLRNAYKKIDYSVGDARSVENGFEVTVTVRPLRLFEDIDADLNDKMSENLEEIQKLAEDEVMDYTLKKELEILKDRVSNPEYGEPQEVVVFISENENSRYAITPESMTLIGNTLFY